MAEDVFTINSLIGKITSVASTLNKSNFNRSIYYLLYMTIPSGGARIKAEFAREEKVLINKCLCVIFNQNCNRFAFPKSQRYSKSDWFLVSNSLFEINKQRHTRPDWFRLIGIPKHVLCLWLEIACVTKGIKSVRTIKMYELFI